jgi:hypothetical protein
MDICNTAMMHFLAKIYVLFNDLAYVFILLPMKFKGQKFTRKNITVSNSMAILYSQGSESDHVTSKYI